MALQEIAPKRGGNRHQCRTDHYVAISSAKNDKGQQVSITLSKRAMQDMRWLSGDRVSVFFDCDDNTLHLKRSINNGYTLTCRSDTAQKKKSELVGKCLPSGIRFSNSHIPNVGFTTLMREDCILMADGIAFIYPEPFQP